MCWFSDNYFWKQSKKFPFQKIWHFFKIFVKIIKKFRKKKALHSLIRVVFREQVQKRKMCLNCFVFKETVPEAKNQDNTFLSKLSRSIHLMNFESLSSTSVSDVGSCKATVFGVSLRL